MSLVKPDKRQVPFRRRRIMQERRGHRLEGRGRRHGGEGAVPSQQVLSALRQVVQDCAVQPIVGR